MTLLLLLNCIFSHLKELQNSPDLWPLLFVQYGSAAVSRGFRNGYPVGKFTMKPLGSAQQRQGAVSVIPIHFSVVVLPQVSVFILTFSCGNHK